MPTFKENIHFINMINEVSLSQSVDNIGFAGARVQSTYAGFEDPSARPRLQSTYTGFDDGMRTRLQSTYAGFDDGMRTRLQSTYAGFDETGGSARRQTSAYVGFDDDDNAVKSSVATVSVPPGIGE